MIKRSCPSTEPYKPFYSNGWKIGSKSYYDDYLINYRYFINQMSLVENRKVSYDLETLKRMVNNVNSYADKFVSSPVNFGSIKHILDVKKAYVSLPVSGDVQVPVYTFYVKADWLEIYQPTPKPKILEARGAFFKSGERGRLYVKFKNVGEKGNFAVWAECTSPFNVFGATTIRGVDSGEIYEMRDLEVGANVPRPVNGKCTIYVRGVGCIGEGCTDSRTVNVGANPQTVCKPLEKMCSRDYKSIIQCNKYGTGWEVVEKCAENEYCTYIEGKPQCIRAGVPPVPPECKWYDIACHIKKIGRAIKTTIITLGVIALLVIIIYLILVLRRGGGK